MWEWYWNERFHIHLSKVRISRCHFWAVDESTIFAPLSLDSSFICAQKKIRNLGRLLTLLGSSGFTDQWLSNAQKNTIFIMGVSLKWQHRNIMDLPKHRRQYNDLQDGTELVGRGYGRDWRLGPRPQPTCLQVLLAHCLHKIRQKHPGIE